MRNGKIDIIIPAYNVKDDLLFTCLSSIATQTLRDISKVTIVDDASTIQNYQSVADKFKNILDIQILRYETNGGPGVARQYGLDHTENEFITFIDADDLFSSGFALQILRQIFDNNNNYEVAIGAFQEVGFVNNGLFLFNHLNDSVWVFGKMYRRSYLKKYSIKFHPTSRANEDNGFNTLCRLYANNADIIGATDEIVYYWCPTEDSITRRNNEEYAISCATDANFYGYVENMIYAINTVNNSSLIKDKNNLAIWSMQVMIQIYSLYLSVENRTEESNYKKCLEYCSWYYKEIYSKFRPLISDEDFLQIYNAEIQMIYARQGNPMPTITFLDFIELIKE